MTSQIPLISLLFTIIQLKLGEMSFPCAHIYRENGNLNCCYDNQWCEIEDQEREVYKFPEKTLSVQR